MTEIQQSLIWVTTGANFWAWASTIFIIGAFLGWKQNNGMSGFKRSLYTLAPLALIYLFSSANRVYEYAKIYGYGAQSFNNLISILLITLLYLGGLLIGHNIKNKAIESAVKESGVPEHERKQMIAKIKEAI
jgi:uncharacterized protein YneF (UPF0154 family)